MSTDNLKNIPFKQRDNCMVCSQPLGMRLLNLPNFPLTEIYTSKKPEEKIGFLDQFFYVCDRCGHGQLSNVISPSVLYGDLYSYRTSTSASGSKVNNAFLNFINKTIKNRHFKTIIEIGCGDLYLLNSLKNQADCLIGIDPILEGGESTDEKVTIINDFVESVDLNELNLDDCLILCSHTLEHVENPKKMIQSLFEHSTENTMFCFQFPGLDSLVENCRFDQIFHQHINLFSSYSFNYMLNDLNASIIQAGTNSLWGSLLFSFQIRPNTNPPSTINLIPSQEQIQYNYSIFQQRMQNLSQLIKSLKEDRIIGYGAALMLPVLAYHLDTDLSELTHIVDDDPNKQGLYYINLPLEIHHSSTLTNLKETTILITAIDNTRRILPKTLQLNPKRIITVTNII
jgi:hypothetical protein